MEWARTLRIDALPSDRVRSHAVAALSHDGLRVRFGGSANIARTYILVEGSAATDPSELTARLPDARSYDEAIIALAIEPTPRDALPPLAQALGAGAPAGVLEAQIFGDELVIELQPSVTPVSMLFRIIDVELERFHGFRRTQLLTALPLDVIARIAAQGLQAPEIGSDRILESLLEAAYVE